MKTHESTNEEIAKLYTPNRLLGLYIIFITALTITYTLVTAVATL